MRAAGGAPTTVVMAPPRKPKPLVLRVEIEPEHVEALSGLLAPGSPAPRLRSVEDEDPALVRREAALAERESRLHDAERRVAELQAEIESSSEGAASSKIRAATYEKRLRELEEQLEARSETLEERETSLYEREATFEADVEMREDRLESWRSELGDLEKRLERKEAELLVYVAQLQEEFVRREGRGWNAVAAHIRH